MGAACRLAIGDRRSAFSRGGKPCQGCAVLRQEPAPPVQHNESQFRRLAIACGPHAGLLQPGNGLDKAGPAPRSRRTPDTAPAIREILPCDSLAPPSDLLPMSGLEHAMRYRNLEPGVGMMPLAGRWPPGAGARCRGSQTQGHAPTRVSETTVPLLVWHGPSGSRARDPVRRCRTQPPACCAPNDCLVH